MKSNWGGHFVLGGAFVVDLHIRTTAAVDDKQNFTVYAWVDGAFFVSLARGLFDGQSSHHFMVDIRQFDLRFLIQSCVLFYPLAPQPINLHDNK